MVTLWGGGTVSTCVPYRNPEVDSVFLKVRGHVTHVVKAKISNEA